MSATAQAHFSRGAPSLSVLVSACANLRETLRITAKARTLGGVEGIWQPDITRGELL